MSERKVLNKYYPPDFDPSKIPRMKLPKNRQYTVRLMAPFNMRCATCGEYIYKGKKFNARKEDVENQDYLGIRIYRFYIKCTRCLQEISFKTDPRNTDYEIEAGATRNFMALKLAEELAQREEEELKEEEASNPMKLLENRTKQSKNEIELLESLEELKDLNKRQQTVDYDTMLSAYDVKLSEREREERLQQLDEEYIKTVKFQSSGKRKVVTEEEIIEDGDTSGPSAIKQSKLDSKTNSSSTEILVDTSTDTAASSRVLTMSAKPKASADNTWNKSIGGLGKKKLVGLVKIKSKETTEENKSSTTTTDSVIPQKAPETTGNGLSLLGAYSDSDESEAND
ncbi:splicing factor YJU2 [Atheta coriaria]|uniref:splicing factor YJU2 n=1 Tax=Dalotia coriaria TaxID=877792 RepID=UPI0031F3F525